MGMRQGSLSRTPESQITSSDARVSLLSRLRTILCKLHCDAFTAWERELELRHLRYFFEPLLLLQPGVAF